MVTPDAAAVTRDTAVASDTMAAPLDTPRIVDTATTADVPGVDQAMAVDVRPSNADAADDAPQMLPDMMMVASTDQAAPADVPVSADDAPIATDMVPALVSDAGDGGGDSATPGDAFNDAGSTPDGGCVANQQCGIGDGGVTGVCKAGQCAVCADPTDDSLCSAAYGSSHLCIAGACLPGVCRTSAACGQGQLCDPASRLCQTCTGDSQCTGDTRYGAGHICAQGQCVMGNCQTSTTCSQKICGAQIPYTCGNCSTDSQCQTDPTYGAGYICNTSAGQCVLNSCASPNTACAFNAADICCAGGGGNKCLPGNCCADAQCGVGGVCVGNICSQCKAVTGGNPVFQVDPVNGDDQTATGSGQLSLDNTSVSRCSFKTLTRALQVIGSNPVPNTTVRIVGSGVSTALAATEAWPIIVPANVSITTTGGAIAATVPAGKMGFRITGDKAALLGSATAPLTINGGGTSGIGISFELSAGAAATLAYVTVSSSGDTGISVTGSAVNPGGTVTVGQGVTVQGAGAAGNRRNGLNILVGTVVIDVPAGQAPTSFKNNTQHGISVGGLGVLTLKGVPGIDSGTSLPNGTGTVVTSGNFAANVMINQTSGAAPATSLLEGLVAWAGQARGLRITAGSKVKVRKSVFLANTDVGVRIEQAADTAAGNDLTNIDLGTMGDPGQNYLQLGLGSNPNLNAGLCVSLSGIAAAQAVKAQGNIFTGPKDCGSVTTAVTKNANNNCTGRVDLGVSPAAITADVAGCTVP